MEGQWIEVETLLEGPADVLFADGIAAPDGFLAGLNDDTALLLHIDALGGEVRMGSRRASVARYQAHTLVSSVPLDRVRGTGFRDAEVHFLGLQGWWPAGAPIEMEAAIDDRGRSTGVTFATRDIPDQVHRIGRGRTLTLGTTWSASGGWDERTLVAPLSFRSSSAKPTEAFDHLQPLLHVQALVSFAHHGFVRARSGTALVDVAPRADGRDEARCPLWVGSLMEPWPSVRESQGRHTPLLTLGTIGGVAGIARWCRLAEQHPRAFSPVVDRYHSGSTSAPVAVREVAAGIEYWVSCHRRSAAWAKKKRAKPGEPDRSGATNLVEHVGRAFDSWAGDGRRWAAAFWDANNGLKHEPDYAVDPQVLSDLAESGRLLLGAALCNRVAGTKEPSRRIFGHHTLERLGERVRSLV